MSTRLYHCVDPEYATQNLDFHNTNMTYLHYNFNFDNLDNLISLHKCLINNSKKIYLGKLLNIFL